MRLVSLRAENVRLFHTLSITPSPGLNLIAGANGSGKSSLLECIHILATGRSSRSRHAGEVIRHGAGELLVFGEVVTEDGRRETVGVEKSRGRTRIRISEEEVYAASALARLMPVLLIGPDSERLMREAAEHRRRLMDWALFHVEPAYLETYSRFQRALRQRNAALKRAGDPRLLASWDEKVAAAGEKLHQLRAAYAGGVVADAVVVTEALLGRAVAIGYQAGWDPATPLVEVLRGSLARDLRRGFTGAGPHRADITLSIDGRPARSVLSRGEGKLLVGGLELAHVAYVTGRTGKVPVVMVDDLGAELDRDGQRRFLATLRKTRSQSFVTMAEAETIEPEGDCRWFHVERGTVREMV